MLLIGVMEQIPVENRLESHLEGITAVWASLRLFSFIRSESLPCEVQHCVLHCVPTSLRQIPFQLLHSLNEATVFLSFKRGKKKFTSWALTAHQADNRLLCRTIWSHSDWQKPNMPFTLSFKKRKKREPKQSGLRGGQRIWQFVGYPMTVLTRHGAHKMFNVWRRSCCQRPGRECLYKHLNSFDTRQSKLTFNSHNRTKLLEKPLLKLLPLT